MEEKNLILLVSLLLLIGFFSSNFSKITGVTPYAKSGVSLNVDNVVCEWKTNHYEVCGEVRWKGFSGYYSKAFVSGESLNDAEKQHGYNYRICEDVGEKDKKVAFNGYVFDAKNKIVAMDLDNEVKCEGNIERRGEFSKKFSFRTNIETGLVGEGKEILRLPYKPRYCDVSGKFVIDDDTINERRTNCDKLEGVFYGYVDENRQYGEVDPELGEWGYSPYGRFDPGREEYDGRIIHMHPCDNQYYSAYIKGKDPDAVVDAWVSNFDNDLEISWVHKNLADRNAEVDFIFELRCGLKGESSGYEIGKVNKEIRTIEVEDIGEFEEEVEEEPFEFDIGDVGKVEERESFWERLKKLFGFMR